MNKINFNQEISRESFKGFIDEHKDYLFPSLAIIISIALFLFVLLPQILAFPKTRTEVNTEEKKLDEFVAARNYAGSVNSADLNTDLILATKALPVDKDYTSMINAVSSAAESSSTTIQSYRFLIGSGTLNKTSLAAGGIPSIAIQVNINGDYNQLLTFMKALYETVPVSEISNVSYSNGSSLLLINFFYKPLPSAEVSTGELIRDKNIQEKDVFEIITNWKVPAEGLSDIIVVPASESGEINSGSPF